MSAWFVISLILAVLVIVLLILLKKQTDEKAYWKRQERRAWTLKVALEKTCNLPTVEPIDLTQIEPQLQQIMRESGTDVELEEQMRQAIMALYDKKRDHGRS